MDFLLSDQQAMIVETARRVGERFGLEYWRACDHDKAFPSKFWQAVCAAGLCGVALPEAYGGSGLGMLEMALIIEALSAAGGGATVAQLFMINPIFGGLSIARFGSPGMRAELLPRIISGTINCCMALTEPDAGSNSLEIATFAQQHGNGWRLNGRKIWITAVDSAHKMLVVARTTKLGAGQRRTQGLSMFMIDVGRKGLTYAPIEKLGTNTLSACSVFFEDVEVDGSELVGSLDGGWSELLDVLNTERIATSAGLVGAADLAFRIAVDYAKTRRVFGTRTIGEYQGIQFPLAQASAEVECARLMNHKAASLFDCGLPYATEANMAKLIAAQAASSGIEHAMQILGGMGFATETHLERLWRDQRLFRFAPISEQMVLNFIATQKLGLPRSY